MAEVERNIVIHQALHVVAGEAGEEGHHFQHALHLRAFQRQAAGHDHADVARAEDDVALAGHIAFHVDPALGGAGGVHAGRACAGDADLGAGALAAAHGQHDGARLHIHKPAALAAGQDAPLRADIQHHGVEQRLDAQRQGLIDEALGVGWAGQVFVEHLQAKTVVDTLLQNAAQLLVAFDQQYVVRAVLLGSNGRRQPAGAGSDDDNIVFMQAGHGRPPLLWCGVSGRRMRRPSWSPVRSGCPVPGPGWRPRAACRTSPGSARCPGRYGA